MAAVAVAVVAVSVAWLRLPWLSRRWTSGRRRSGVVAVMNASHWQQSVPSWCCSQRGVAAVAVAVVAVSVVLRTSCWLRLLPACRNGDDLVNNGGTKAGARSASAHEKVVPLCEIFKKEIL